MPTYMDRHNAPDATYDAMAEAHRLDLDLQERYDVRFLAYWFDPHRGLAFCLADAPSAEAMKQVHAASHGAIPSDIREVDLKEVVALLGRATEPDQSDPTAKEFRPDSAFRAILFTDMIDSTALTLHLGDAGAVELLERHDRAISAAVTLHGGRIVKHTGDGFMISFDDVDNALRASIRIQNEVSSLHELLSIRVGINAGNPIERDGDFFGLTIQLTARVCEHAEAGQILVSGILHELCEDSSIADRFIDRGRVQLKGFSNALQVYELDYGA
jgi:class 3 adenylate cyclase